MQVVILGGGIVGLTMANLLADQQQLHITLIEAKPINLKPDFAEYDLRVSAITRAAQNVLRHLGIWETILQVRAGVYAQMHIWQQDTNSHINFAAEQIGQTDLGHIIENKLLLNQLYKRILQYSNVTIIESAAQHLELNAQFNRIKIADRWLAADLIIGADGANSWLRQAVNIDTYAWDYQHSALVATIQTELSHKNMAQQRFAADGPLAFLPLAESDLSSIVWSSTPAKINHLMQIPAEEFCVQLAAEFAHKHGKLKLLGQRACFPLRMLHAKQYIANRVVLIGDAAHVIHPLAGQGLNLGILDAATLAEIISQALVAKQDIGQQAILRKYERWRKTHNATLLSIVEIIKRIFATEQPLLALLRNSGMQYLNKFGLAKDYILNFAMGLSGELPNSARAINLQDRL